MMLKKIKDYAYRSVFVAGFALIAALLIIVTINSVNASSENVNQTAAKLSSFYMEELVDKRAVVLQDSLHNDLEQLNRVVSLLKDKDLKDQQSLREFLSDAQTLYNVRRLAIVDEENTVYTPHSTFSDASRYSFLQDDLTGGKIVTSNLYGAKKQVVLAVPAEGISFQGKKINACFMQIDIDDVAGSLTYENENEPDNTFIGLYYKNGDNLTTSSFGDIEPGQNLLEYIRSAQLSETQSFEEIEKNFTGGQRGLATIESGGETKYLYFIPVENTDWMLTVMVNDNTIADQLEYTRKIMLQRSTFQLIFTAVFIIAVLLMISFLNKRNNEMHLRQKELEEKTRNEEALRIARDEAERANKAKTDFLFNMSHDIRTPMNAIIGFTDMAMKHIDDKERVFDSLGKTKEAGELLLSLINDILDMSRIESGKISLTENAGDAYLCFATIKSTMEELAKAKDIELTFSVENIEDRYVYCDFSRCMRVFVNIITNAIKYTNPGGHVKVKCEQVGKKDGYGIYRFTFEDDGIGMSEEFQKHAFDVFTRENSATVSGIQGTGLGLSVCKSFVEAMNGTIELTSKQGVGTTFTVTLPFKIQEGTSLYTDVESGQVTDGEVETDGKNIDLSGSRVLLVEDNELNREIAECILTEDGMTVESANDGTVAVRLMKEKGPDYYDYILMDIQMPVMSGYEATKLIRRMYPDANIPIIALSANAFEEDKEASINAGMNDHVAKPINIGELKKAMAKHRR